MILGCFGMNVLDLVLCIGEIGSIGGWILNIGSNFFILNTVEKN